jgi:hypothetical protein
MAVNRYVPTSKMGITQWEVAVQVTVLIPPRKGIRKNVF